MHNRESGGKGNTMTKVFAHRGASGYAPENTLPAFALAEEQGADGVELDVQLTRDGQVVVIHDEKINRTSDGEGFVRDYTLEELKAFSFHAQMEEYRGVKIPTLEEVLKTLKPGKMQVNIELKTGIFWYPEIEKKTIDIVRRMGMENRVIYSSFNHYSIQEILKLNPLAETAYLFSDVILHMEDYGKKTGVQGLHPAVYHLYMPELLEDYKKSGLKIRVWTVNRKEDMKKFIENDLEAVITNYPDLALEVRKQVEDVRR